MEKKTLMEVIKENRDSIIRRALIVLGSVGGLLLVAKVLSGDEADIEENVEETEPQDVEFSEVENEEEK